MAKRSSRVSGVILVLISATVFSSAGLFVKGVDADMWSILFWRGVSATIFTLAYVAWRGRLHGEFRAMGNPGLWAAIIGASATLAFIPAFKHTSIANVSLIYAAAPFVCAVIAWLWMSEQPTRAVLASSLAAFAGVGIIVTGSLHSLNLQGDILALWMTLGMAGVLCIYRRYPSTPAAGPATLSSLILLPIAWLIGDPMSTALEEILIICVFGLVFALGSVTLAEGAKRLPAAETALIGALETPLAPLWAVLIFAELPTAYTLLGGGIILIAVISSQYFGRRAELAIRPQAL